MVVRGNVVTEEPMHRFKLHCSKCDGTEFEIDTLGDEFVKDCNNMTIECLGCGKRFDYEDAIAKDLGVA